MSFVLVTGATGEVARGVVPLIEPLFTLRLLALESSGGDPRRVQVDLLDWHALGKAMDGATAVLHLAVAPGHSGTYEDDAFNDPTRFDRSSCAFSVTVRLARAKMPGKKIIASCMKSPGSHRARNEWKFFAVLLMEDRPL